MSRDAATIDAANVDAADIVVLRGRPDERELAALITVLAALRAHARVGTEPLAPPRAPWTRPARYRPAGAWTARPQEQVAVHTALVTRPRRRG